MRAPIVIDRCMKRGQRLARNTTRPQDSNSSPPDALTLKAPWHLFFRKSDRISSPKYQRVGPYTPTAIILLILIF